MFLKIGITLQIKTILTPVRMKMVKIWMKLIMFIKVESSDLAYERLKINFLSHCINKIANLTNHSNIKIYGHSKFDCVILA